ncbi:hypothetical protein MD484_g4296, partial [Candolleomyces efflorescens]
MHAGDQKPASRPFTCASFLEASVAETSAYGLRLQDAYEKSHRPKISIDELDQDQKISACLLEEEEEDEEEPSPSSTTSATSSVHSYSYSPSPIPIQATSSDSPELSSSPAALFLSAFMSPKVEPAALPDDEGQAVGGYTLGPIVGFGGFSTIRKATSASGGVVAIKIIRRADLVRTGHAPHERKKLEHEAKVWASLSHEHILPLFSAVHTSYADYFVTLYCPAGSLYDILKRDGSPALPQDDAGMMFRQVVRGLRYLHEDALFVHRDMKLENVLVDESGVCRIGDFGLSVNIGPGRQSDEDEAVILEDEDHHHQHQHDTSGVGASSLNPIARHHSARHRSATSSQLSHVYQPGSLPYAAPELLLPQSAELAHPQPSQDIWALGCMLYALLAGHLPFNDSFEPRLQMKILNGVFELPKDIGRGAERILHGCLERNVPKRWNIAMVDEVAWGVGWGSAGDGATPEAELSESLCYGTASSTSKSEDGGDVDEAEPYQAAADAILNDDDEDWQQEERIARPAMEAATRRSSSRVKRSLSRAPMIPARTPGSGRSMSRQRHSRASSPPPSSLSVSFFHHAGMDSASPSSGHSPICSPYYETPSSRSRSASRPRGRRPTKNHSYFPSPSRSPSPSMAPRTPLDLGSHILARMHLEDHPEELELEPAPRGRSLYAPVYQDDDQDDAAAYDPTGHDVVEIEDDKLGAQPQSVAAQWTAAFFSGFRQGQEDEASRSTTSSEDSSSRYRSCSSEVGADEEDVVSTSQIASIPWISRPGSTPPTTGATPQAWDTGFSPGKGEGLVAPKDYFLGAATLGGSGATSPALISRSRSADVQPQSSLLKPPHGPLEISTPVSS